MLILAQFCKWASCYQTAWAICVVFFLFLYEQQHVIMAIQGKIVCTDKAGSGYGI